MFIMYTSASGTNVTISPRLGTGHVQPLYTGAVGYQLLEGSGVINDTFGSNLVANVRCTNCRSWAGGSVNVKSTSQPMIYAIGDAEDELQTDDHTATIHQHDGYGQFTMNMVAATGAGGIPSDTSKQTGTVHEDDQGGSGGPGGALHALFMCGSFIVLFPAGYLFLRIFERVWIHIAFQSFGLFATLLGSASGIALSIKTPKVCLSSSSSTSLASYLLTLSPSRTPILTRLTKLSVLSSFSVSSPSSPPASSTTPCTSATRTPPSSARCTASSALPS